MSILLGALNRKKMNQPTHILPAVPMTSRRRLARCMLALTRCWLPIRFTASPCTQTNCPCRHLCYENCQLPSRKLHTLRMSVRSYISCTLEIKKWISDTNVKRPTIIKHTWIIFAIVLGVLFAVVSEVMANIVVGRVKVFRILGIICKTR